MASSTPPLPLGASTSHNGKVENQAFGDAYRRFFESLSPKEQPLYSPCASHEDFIEAMGKLEKIANERRKRGSSRYLDRISALSDRLQPFFDIVNIMVQSNPKYTALAWGALRFILQLASSFSTFFEKLIATLERFCYEIPQYENVHALQGDQISARIKECTEKLYGQMFQFFREVANIFTSGGRIKRTPVVIAELLWRPFENRFDGLLKQVQSYRGLIEFDVILLQAQAAEDTKAVAWAQKQITEKEREERMKMQKQANEMAATTDHIARMVSRSHQDVEQLFERIQRWLSPPQYSDAFLSGKSLRESGTNQWILTNSRFYEWRECEWAIKPNKQPRKAVPNILWIEGNPGSGKSVLASSIIEELKARCSQGGQRQEVCYFFFSSAYKDSTTRISAYRSILAQIVHIYRHNDDMINKFDFIMTDPSSSGTPKAGLDELFELVKLLLEELEIFLILDGIDECEDDSSLMEEIVELLDFSSAKILLCGRTSTASLTDTVPENARICLDRGTVNGDIRLFISTRIAHLLERDLLPPGSNSEDLIDHLCRGADGMFLWAKLMFNYLRLPVHDPYSRLEVIRSVVFPEGLEEMYARIVRTIFRAGKTSRDFASGILAWASYSMQPLTLEELYDQMTFSTSKTANIGSDQLNAFQRRVCIVCGGLVEFFEIPDQPTAYGVLRYIHLSVKEHFSQVCLEFESQALLVSPEPIEHLKCAGNCLGYLLHHVPARRGYIGDPDPTDPPLGEFSRYASRNWMIHLDLSFSSASFNGSDISPAFMTLEPSLSDFLNDVTKVKFWIHILYILSEAHGIPSCLDELALTLRSLHHLPASIQALSETLQRFCHDVSKALNAWDKHLRNSTDVLWDEMIIFSESPFIAGTRKGQVISMAPAPPPDSIHPKSRLVRKVSHTSVDGETTAVVSTWQNLRSPTKSVVKYELWKHNNVPTRLSEIINLMEHQQTFNMYPISISDDLGSFAVMDRLFTLVPNGNDAPISTRSIKIPVVYRTYPTDPYTIFFKVSAQGRFLLSSDSSTETGLHEKKRSCMKITMFEIENDELLQIKPILHKNFLFGAFFSVLEAIFHPSHAVVIMRGESWIAAWSFAREDENESESSFETLHYAEPVKNITLSSCGKFVVFEGMTERQPTILSIPERFLTPRLSSFNEVAPSPRSDSQQERSTTESFLSTRRGESSLQLSPGRPVQPSQILTLANGMPAQLISVQGGEEVKIARTSIQSNHADEVMNIVRLPQFQGINEATPTIVAPAPGDESIRIILDENGRGGQQQTNELPVFISRDINAIKHTFYDGAGQHVDGGRTAARQQIRNREESESEQVTKRRRTETI